MHDKACDILVVGAGPAGASAARKAALSGAYVLLAEQRDVVGVPVQCAEFIPKFLFGKIEMDKSVIAQSVKGMETYVNGAFEVFTRAPGYVIHRDRFDQALVKAAEDAGAQVMMGARAVDLEKDGAVILKCKNKELIKIQPRIIIGADGPRSKVGQWVNAGNAHLLPGAQVSLALTQPMEHTEVHFHPAIYAGYGWVFPKGDAANVGVGFRNDPGSGARAFKILENFVSFLKKEGKVKGNPIRSAAGWIPAQAVRKAVYGRIALVGDAAGHTHPITGAGIFAAVTGGQMAGKWAGRAVMENDESLLQKYDEEWLDLMGDTLKRAHRRRQEMESHWRDFNDVIKRCWIAFRAYYE